MYIFLFFFFAMQLCYSVGIGIYEWRRLFHTLGSRITTHRNYHCFVVIVDKMSVNAIRMNVEFLRWFSISFKRQAVCFTSSVVTF